MTILGESRVEYSAWRETALAIACAVLAAAAIKLPEVFGLRLDGAEGFYARNLSLFVLPPLTLWLAMTRGLSLATCAALVVAFVLAFLAANAPGFASDDPRQALVALHLPIALWLAVGIAHAGGRWREAGARMAFVRFTGEWLIHYVLIALGGVVLMACAFALFRSLGVDLEPIFERWILPCGAAGAVVIAAWLVDAGQGAVRGMATVLTRLFAPMFALLLLLYLATMAWAGHGPQFHRDLLIAFDLLLALVVCLLLYSIAGRDASKPAGVFDGVQLVLIVAALLVDAAALWAIGARIGEFGFTANRVAALGENLILLANLAGAAWLQLRFLRVGASFATLERWQVRFLPVYSAWAALVVALFPWIFG